MQAPTSNWYWPQVVAGAVVASIGAILGYLIKRKQLPYNLRKIEADANYSDAQADDLRFRTGLGVVERFDEMVADIGELQFQKMQLKTALLKEQERVRVLEKEITVFKAERTLRRLSSGSIESVTEDDGSVQ